ncbi:MAG TPA: hypothetical protein DCE41_36150 [Cytophagales bacterium]|nr:hypothetical protein [Cytophagales bacterium]
MKTLSYSLLGLSILFLSSCDWGVSCTEEFRTVGIDLTGGTPDDFYTLRSSTGDTIRLMDDAFPGDFYPVIDDSWQEELQGSEEEFVFEAVVDGTVVVSETFVIEADLCHINKVSGPDSASLE